MSIAQTRVTSQGQISVPVEVRRRLGVGPGSTLEWVEEGDGRIVVRRAGDHTSEDIHKALFRRGPGHRTVEQMKEGIRRRVKRRHAGR